MPFFLSALNFQHESAKTHSTTLILALPFTKGSFQKVCAKNRIKNGHGRVIFHMFSATHQNA